MTMTKDTTAYTMTITQEKEVILIIPNKLTQEDYDFMMVWIDKLDLVNSLQKVEVGLKGLERPLIDLAAQIRKDENETNNIQYRDG